jgi:hypothetical protein
MQVGTRSDSTAIQTQAAYFVAALNEGYFVSVVDDTGPKAAFSE